MKLLSEWAGMGSASIKVVGCVLLGWSLASSARAADGASAQLTSSAIGGGDFDYTITLTNTGTNNLETFWFAWVPGENFLPSAPLSVTSPTNWAFNITHGGSSDGYAIQWLTSSSSTPSPITPGSTLTFSFESTASPQTIAGTSPFYSTKPIGTSFVYSGAPFSDSGAQFVVSVANTPEPSSLALSLLGGAGLVYAACRRFHGRRAWVEI